HLDCDHDHPHPPPFPTRRSSDLKLHSKKIIELQRCTKSLTITTLRYAVLRIVFDKERMYEIKIRATFYICKQGIIGLQLYTVPAHMRHFLVDTRRKM